MENVQHNETITLTDDEKVMLLLDIGEVKRNTEAIKQLVKETRLGIIITIIFSATALILSAAAIIH